MKKNQKTIEEIKKILLNESERSLFILEYTNFGNDGNDRVYKKFILNTLAKQTDVNSVSDAIQLAIEIEWFNGDMLIELKKYLLSRRHYLVRIVCLDYIIHFRKKISNGEFYSLCKKLIISRNPLLKTQSLVILTEKDASYFSRLTRELSKAKYPTVFYRCLSTFNESKISLRNQDKQLLKQIIHDMRFKDSVEKELLKMTRSIGLVPVK